MNREDLEQLAEALGGLSILGCFPGSPADLAGLRYGDIVLEVNGISTPNWMAYVEAIRQRTTSMSVRYFRGGEEQHVTFELPQGRGPMSPLSLVKSVLSAGALSGTQSSDEDDDEEEQHLIN